MDELSRSCGGGASEHSSQRGHRPGSGGSGLLHGRPLLTIGPEVVLGEDCKLISHVVLDGRTRIGARNTFYPFCAIGVAPQDLKYKGEPTADRDRRRQHHSRVRDHQPRHGGGRRHHADRLGQPADGLRAHRPRQPGGQPLHPGQLRHAGRPRDHRGLRQRGRVLPGASASAPWASTPSSAAERL